MRTRTVLVLVYIFSLLTILTPTVAYAHPTEPEYIGQIWIPEGYAWETTPTVLHNGMWIPEESPNGGYPINISLDNSPLYSDGYMLQIHEESRFAKWVDTTGQLAYIPND